MKKYIIDFKVLENKKLNDQNTILVLQSDEKLPEILAGQFVEVLVEDSPSTFLRRPFSVHNVDFHENTLSLFIKIAGIGSKKLTNIEVGENLNLIFPLGNGFSIPNEGSALLIGGGCGIGPLLFLAKCLMENNVEPHIILGGRSKEDIFEVHEYSKYGTVHITTDDGSLGEKGFVTKHTIIDDPDIKFDIIYTCGPEIMMKAVAKMAKSKGIECEVSLENTMACGIGACLCCVTETIDGNKCVCTEGPVFNINDLKWQI
ncbi:MAG: dihydroorotate dehydrogenase electron transfer subunit [Bacteroidetes bacterium]|nr:dihydroorotate dehydrogenase electron transfer subunit [Bacteroidota bacterium]